MKRLLIAIIILVLTLLVACSGQVEQPPEKTPRIGAGNGNCVRFMHHGSIEITGSESEASERFLLYVDEWVVDWSYVPDPEHIWHRLYLSIYSGKEASDFTYMINSNGATSGSSYIYDDAGGYGIDIEAIGIESWKIVISLPKS